MSDEPALAPQFDMRVELMRDRLRSRMFGIEAEVRRVGQYALVKSLGEGGQGTVWAAYDEKLDRRVAIKLLHSEVGASREQAEARLLREARALARVSHPNVVQVFEADEYEDGIYVVMEFIRGRTIDRWIADESPNWEAVRDVYLTAGRGLEAAHQSGLVHRDFKPDNVLVDARGQAKVVDFGLVKREGKKPSEATSTVEQRLRKSATGNLTEHGAVLGTPVFMAPEQMRTGEASARSDQFSFCTALYRSLYDELPFPGDTPVERTVAIAEGRVRPAPVHSEVPTWLRDVILRGLKVKPDDRHADIGALLEALANPAPQSTGARPAEGRRYVVWVAIGVAVATAISFAVFAQ